MPFRCVRVRAVLPADTTALPTSFRPYAPPQAGSRGFLVEIDMQLRRLRGKLPLKGDDLRLQRLVWMCDANQSVIAELVAIIGSSLVQVLMKRHALAFAIGYKPDEALDVPTVFVQMMVELLLEMVVDSTVMWAEGEHGIPVTRYFEHVRSLSVAGFHAAFSILAVAWVLFSFIRFPTVATCESENVCECLDKPLFDEWFAQECNLTATNQTAAKKTDDTDLFKNVDGVAVLIAIVTGIAMAALIWLSVMFSRYRKRNQVVVMLEGGMEAAKHKLKAAEAFNAELKASLGAAQKIVDRNVKEGGALLSAYKIRHSDLTMDVQLGEGSFGTVYHGTYRGRECAVKTVRDTKVTDQMVKGFIGELTLMAPLRHPNLVGLVGGCWTDGPDKLCIVLEYCSKGSLGGMVKDPSNTWEEQYYDIALGVARCFRYLHHEQPGEPLIHRDLKPDNVLIAGDGIAKVADFGESTRFEEALAAEEEDGALSMTTACVRSTRRADLMRLK